MNGLLEGAKALITGGNRGIGRAVAEGLAAQGARVAVACRDEATGRATVEALGGEGRAWWFALDVTDSSQVDQVVDQAAEAMGGLTIVVNNAGVIDRAPLGDLTHERWHRVIRTNLTGAFYVTRAALRHLPEHAGARIINVSSVVAVFGVPDNAPYVASKTGMLGLTRTAAVELAPKGITVNAVCPGWTDTEMTDQGVKDLAAVWGLTPDEARTRIIREMVPIGRLLKPEEIAASILWLCSRQADAITAQVVRVDGGQTPF